MIKRSANVISEKEAMAIKKLEAVEIISSEEAGVVNLNCMVRNT
jgi:hypothetical protein